MDVRSADFRGFFLIPRNEHLMTSVHRRPVSKFWHTFFRDSEGRLIDQSTRLGRCLTCSYLKTAHSDSLEAPLHPRSFEILERQRYAEIEFAAIDADGQHLTHSNRYPNQVGNF